MQKDVLGNNRKVLLFHYFLRLQFPLQTAPLLQSLQLKHQLVYFFIGICCSLYLIDSVLYIISDC